jgi:hypothetical protein
MTARMVVTKQILCIAALSMWLCGCIPPSSDMNLISLGMTKQQVIEVMGEPDTTTATYTNEYFNYALAEGCLVSMTLIRCPLTPYFARFINGKVDAYGRSGDFGTMQKSPQKSIIEQK